MQSLLSAIHHPIVFLFPNRSLSGMIRLLYCTLSCRTCGDTPPDGIELSSYFWEAEFRPWVEESAGGIVPTCRWAILKSQAAGPPCGRCRWAAKTRLVPADAIMASSRQPLGNGIRPTCLNLAKTRSIFSLSRAHTRTHLQCKTSYVGSVDESYATLFKEWIEGFACISCPNTTIVVTCVQNRLERIVIECLCCRNYWGVCDLWVLWQKLY